jgi:uncharacterized membrane protein YeaQ/YmgE (transglycosylase-associated protein family)
MSGIFWTIVLGFVIGVLARFLHPGKDSMGFIVTILLGIAGEGAGFIASVVVAILLLFIVGKLRGSGQSGNS